MPSPIRLNKVLKELNISLDRAIEFLSSKNIEIVLLFSGNDSIAYISKVDCTLSVYLE